MQKVFTFGYKCDKIVVYPEANMKYNVIYSDRKTVNISVKNGEVIIKAPKKIKKSELLKIIEKHGADRLLFGTDTPWHTPEMELRLLNNLGLKDEEMEKITHKNAEKLLRL